MNAPVVLSGPTDEPCAICGAKPSFVWFLLGGIFSWLCTDCRTDYSDWISKHPSFEHFWQLAGPFAAHAQGFPQPGGMFFDPKDFLDLEAEMRTAVHQWIMTGRRLAQSEKEP